ncbi:MAG TPA: hypothetical protein VI011_14115, partial [Asanoa sp.]
MSVRRLDLHGTALVLSAPSARARLAAAIYAVSVAALFASSARYHRVRWRSAAGALAGALVIAVWGGAAAGIVLTLAWIDAPEWLSRCLYVLLGWVGALAVLTVIATLGAGLVAGSGGRAAARGDRVLSAAPRARVTDAPLGVLGRVGGGAHGGGHERCTGDHEAEGKEAAGDPDSAGADRVVEDEDPADDRGEVGGHGGERDDLDAVADLEAAGRGVEGDH